MKLLITLVLLLSILSCTENKDAQNKSDSYDYYYPDSKPLVRWWWHASEYDENDIQIQLDWIKANNFGGVEIAWIYPVNRDTNHPKIKWLGEEWQQLTKFTKEYCDDIGLHCDFTFGTLWPFGGTFVPDSLSTKVLNNPDFKQELRLSWEHPKTGNVIDHMDSSAFAYYASVMGDAIKPALKGSKSALFCDSWEVETRYLSTDGFTERFIRTYGYNIRDFADSLYSENHEQVHYDYMKLVADYVTENFYKEFHKFAHNNNAFTRVQCAGSPTDLITAYSYADVPESEAMLYEPNFSNIVSSAAILNGKKEVSAETFTCLYGFPDIHFGEEKITDLKLVADALFANGVNQIAWHGMPYNPESSDSIKFYATVHTGPDAAFADDIPGFNTYMQKVSSFLKHSEPVTNVAVYLPLEDAWIAQELPEEKQMKWSWGEYELRYVHFPDYTKKYNPIWINEKFIKKGKIKEGKLIAGNANIDILVIKSEYLDIKTLKTINEKAEEGLKIFFEKRPKQAGKFKSKQFIELLNEIFKRDNVYEEFENAVDNLPFITGEELPEFIIRKSGDDYYIFFAHPFASNLTLPVEYGFSETDKNIEKEVTINTNGVSQNLLLVFEPYQSVIVKINKNNEIQLKEIQFNTNKN